MATKPYRESSSYDALETALADILKHAPGFNSQTVAQGHYRNIHEGLQSITLTPGPFNRSAVGLQSYVTTWTINLQLFMRQTKDRLEDMYEDIRWVRQGVIDLIDTFPTLNGAIGVTFAMITSGSEPEWVQIGRTTLWTQGMTVEVTQQLTVPGINEYTFAGTPIPSSDISA